MNDQDGRSARLRHIAAGALVALAAVGAIAGAGALAASPPAKTQHNATAANGSITKPAGSPVSKTGAPRPPVNHQPFLSAIERLVDNATITSREGRTVDREIVAGTVDTNTLASSGFTQTQLQAVEQALGNAKRAVGRTAPPPPGPGKNSTPQREAKQRHS